MRDAIAQAIVDIMYAQGWTCDYHEPDVRCSECKKAWKRTADAVMGLLAELPTVVFQETGRSEGWFDYGERSGMLSQGRYALVRLGE